MTFGLVDEHRGIWPVRVMCEALGLSASRFYAWRSRSESSRAQANRALTDNIRLIPADPCGPAGGTVGTGGGSSV